MVHYFSTLTSWVATLPQSPTTGDTENTSGILPPDASEGPIDDALGGLGEEHFDISSNDPEHPSGDSSEDPSGDDSH